MFQNLVNINLHFIEILILSKELKRVKICHDHTANYLPYNYLLGKLVLLII